MKTADLIHSRKKEKEEKMNKGWISLHRKFVYWEWYEDANTMRLFLHLLLCANHQNKKWRGILIRRGQLITTLSKLADSLKLSKMQIRNSLTKLKTTHEITHLTTPEYSIISINNYNFYQDDNTQTTRKQHAKEHTSNTRATLNNNDNNSTINSINLSLSTEKKERDFSNLSQEEIKLLKKYAKKNGARNQSAYVRKLIDNGDYLNILQEEKQKQAQIAQKRKKAAEQKKKEQETQEPELTEEERQIFLEKMREKAGITKKRGKKQ